MGFIDWGRADLKSNPESSVYRGRRLGSFFLHLTLRLSVKGKS